MFRKIIMMILVIALVCPYAYADGVGRVTYVEGRVDVSARGSDSASSLREGDLISIGDAVRTKSNSKAEITFNDKSVIRLAQSTRIEIKDYVLDGNNNRKTADIMLDRGKARTIIAKMPDKADFVISTPNARGVVKGSDVFAFYQAGNSGMLVSQGTLSVVNSSLPDKNIMIPAGNSVLVSANESPKGPRAYVDLEKKLYEQDTAIPDTISRRPGSMVIRGAIAAMSGDVRIIFKQTGVERKATINDIVGEGDTIVTGADGMVEIKFENGNGINLKSKTRLRITKLAQDPKTGQYENKFESSEGLVRARIEKLKETKSTFEIKTPTAVCGARATLMYMRISPAGTRCFFEGGIGDLASAIANIHKEVNMGNAAYADNNGNVSDPYIPGDDERFEWTSNWEPGNGTEGYVSPGSTLSITLTGGLTITPVTDVELQGLFSDPLFNILAGTGALSGSETEVTSSGSFYGYTSYYDTWHNGAMQGLTQLNDGTLWDGGSADLISAGNYGADGYEPFIWFGQPETGAATGAPIYSYDANNGTYTTYDGGAFYGTAVGVGGSTITEGAVQLMFVDPDGNFGFAFGDQDGIYSLSDGSYLFTGTVTGETPIGNFGILPGDFVESVNRSDISSSGLYGSFSGEGYINGDIYAGLRHYIEHDGAKMGIFDIEIWGTGVDYYNPFSSSDYSFDIGEQGKDYTYWLMNSTGTWESNKAAGSVTGRSLSGTVLGQIDGYLYGLYRTPDGAGYGDWMAAAVGIWTEELLGWSSRIGSSYGVFDSGYGGITESGSQSGVIGAVTSPLDAPGTSVSAVLMGSSDPEDDAVTWWGKIDGSYAGDGSAVPKGSGFIAGRTDVTAESVKGILESLYVDSKGNAGIIEGDFEGQDYPELGMWEADGSLTATEKSDRYAAGYSSDWNYIDGYYTGYFGKNFKGSIESDGSIFDTSYGALGSYTSWLVNLSGSKEDWGVFNIELGGYYDKSDYSGELWKIYFIGGSWTSDGGDLWLARASGTEWSEGVLSGVLEGFYSLTKTAIGFISGRILGSYDTWDSDTWEAIALGSFEEKKLSWSADTGEFSSHYFNESYSSIDRDEEDVSYTLIGSIDSPFTSPGTEVNVFLKGEVASGASFTDRTSWGYLAGSYADTSNVPEGFIGIACNDIDEVRGIVAALYIDGNGRAGTLCGKFDGRYYGDDDIFSGFGTITANERASGFTHGWSSDFNYIKGDLSGSFGEDGDGFIYNKDGSGDYVNIYDSSYGQFGSYTSWLVNIADLDNPVTQKWGIFNVELGGVYDGKPSVSDDWKIALSGNSWRDGDDYWFATIKGDKWSDNLITGSMTGVWIESAGGDAIRMGSINGDMVGNYVEVDGESGTWTAISAGEWVEVTELLDKTAMFGAGGLGELDRFVNVPITEVYSNMLTQVGVGSVAGGVSVGNTASDFLNFIFSQWESNKWVADYNGNVGSTAITGQAGGTYDSGAFTGVGAGINGDILNTVSVSGNYSSDGTISNTTANVALYTPEAT